MRSALESQQIAKAPEVFRRALPLIEAVFREYRIPEATAQSAQTDLETWFLRFCRRNRDIGPESQILAVLSLACSFARGYQAARPGRRSRTGTLSALLDQPPEAVAERIAAAAGVPGTRSKRGAWRRLQALARRSER